MRRDGTGVGPFRVSTFTVLNVLTLFTSVLVSHSSVASLKDNGVALLKDDGVSSLGNDSTDERAVSPSLMGRIKPVGEAGVPPKSTFWVWENLGSGTLGTIQTILRMITCSEPNRPTKRVLQRDKEFETKAMPKLDDNSKFSALLDAAGKKTVYCASQFLRSISFHH